MRLRYGIWIALLALCLLPQQSYGQTITIPVTNTNWFFSPYNWHASAPVSPSTTTEMVTNNPGAYFIFQFSNSTQITVKLDLLGTPPGGGTTTLKAQWSIDGTLHSPVSLDNTVSNLSLATGLTTGTHTVQFWFTSSDINTDRWDLTDPYGAPIVLANGSHAPQQSVRIVGMTLDSGATALAPSSLRPKRILFYGDSITEGINALGTGENDATQTYAITVARRLNAEYGIVGGPGQGWVATNSPHTYLPAFPNAYTLQYASTSRFPISAPDYVVVNMGTNDGSSDVSSTVSTWLSNMRTYFPTSQVFLVIPFDGYAKSSLVSAFTSYVGAHPSDTKVALIDLGSQAAIGLMGTPSAQAMDGTHPNAATHFLLGNQLTVALQTALGSNDFNGDGLSDLVLQNTSTNQVASLFLNNGTVLGTGTVPVIPDKSYQVVGSGDFNGDGKPDYLFQNQSTGQLVIWYMNGTTYSGGVVLAANPGPNYKVVSVGDFNGDGKPDIVFQNQTTNEIGVWFMTGSNGSIIGGTGVVDTIPYMGYQVVGSADFNRDGQRDLLFQNTSSGLLVLWHLNGLHYAGGAYISTLPFAGYHVVAITDLNRDGLPDVILANAAGHIAIWNFNDTTLYSYESVTSLLNSSYRIVGPR